MMAEKLFETNQLIQLINYFDFFVFIETDELDETILSLFIHHDHDHC